MRCLILLGLLLTSSTSLLFRLRPTLPCPEAYAFRTTSRPLFSVFPGRRETGPKEPPTPKTKPKTPKAKAAAGGAGGQKTVVTGSNSVITRPQRRPSSSSRSSSSSSSRSGANDDHDDDESGGEGGGGGGFRLNKCLSSLSRRAADEAISSGRVTINGSVAPPGSRVQARDVVRLDGQLQHWQVNAEAKATTPQKTLEERAFVYVKYWKPVGVTCTSDPKDASNIIKAGNFDLFPQRLFTVGRLDKDSTGLILLTSDGRVNNAMLSPLRKKEKVYLVDLNRAPSEAHVQELRDGVVITTQSQRERSSREVTAKTKPCRVKRIPAADPTSKRLEITLTEGRNRQIRKMVEAIGMQVVALHRTQFCGISLRGLAKGNWLELSEDEMGVVQRALGVHEAGGSNGGEGSFVYEDFE